MVAKSLPAAPHAAPLDQALSERLTLFVAAALDAALDAGLLSPRELLADYFVPRVLQTLLRSVGVKERLARVLDQQFVDERDPGWTIALQGIHWVQVLGIEAIWKRLFEAARVEREAFRPLLDEALTSALAQRLLRPEDVAEALSDKALLNQLSFEQLKQATQLGLEGRAAFSRAQLLECITVSDLLSSIDSERLFEGVLEPKIGALIEQLGSAKHNAARDPRDASADARESLMPNSRVTLKRRHAAKPATGQAASVPPKPGLFATQAPSPNSSARKRSTVPPVPVAASPAVERLSERRRLPANYAQLALPQLNGLDNLYCQLDDWRASAEPITAETYVRAIGMAFDHDLALAQASLLPLLELLNPLLFLTCPDITLESPEALAARLYEEESRRSEEC